MTSEIFEDFIILDSAAATAAASVDRTVAPISTGTLIQPTCLVELEPEPTMMVVDEQPTTTMAEETTMTTAATTVEGDETTTTTTVTEPVATRSSTMTLICAGDVPYLLELILNSVELRSNFVSLRFDNNNNHICIEMMREMSLERMENLLSPDSEFVILASDQNHETAEIWVNRLEPPTWGDEIRERWRPFEPEIRRQIQQLKRRVVNECEYVFRRLFCGRN
jgi:hypothetical protein